VPISITYQPEVPANIKGDDNMDKEEVMQHIQEETDVDDLDFMRYKLHMILKIPTFE
jgi:hypothetical protein